MASDVVVEALGAEAGRLSEVVLGACETAFSRLSLCPPWSVGELLYHVRIGVGRTCEMLAVPEPPAGPLTSAAGYFRHGQRFSPRTNRDRIAAAQRGGAALASGSVIAREFDLAWRESWAQVQQASQTRLVRTHHGDTMLLIEFLRTRVLEVAVHGLDLAAGLGCPFWMTDAAAHVVEDLLLPAGTRVSLLDESGWSHATLIAKATGRLPLSEADARLLSRHSLSQLCLAPPR